MELDDKIKEVELKIKERREYSKMLKGKISEIDTEIDNLEFQLNEVKQINNKIKEAINN